MKRLSSPMRVTPPPPVVPRLTVENSRKRLPSPMTSSVCSPPNFRSWGSPPTEENESKMFLRPTRAGPRTTACGSRIHSSPNSTPSPTKANAPMRTFFPRRAPVETMARESTSLIARTNRVARRGVAGRFIRLAVHQHAAHDAFCGNVAVHCGHRLQLAEFYLPLQHRHLDAQLISGHHRAPETRLIHRGQIEQFFIAIRNFRKQQQSAGLGHPFDDQHARHDRFAREMTLEKALIDGDVFQADDALQPLDFDDRVHQQERIAVRQNFLYARVVENHLMSSVFPAACTNAAPLVGRKFAQPTAKVRLGVVG